ncbi:hypothetical protein ABL78_5878 [Leptomonas seymouri]|uniref:Transmembrane protein n=1 Tax=Leptomonas seymouri TaxID=5684 RepID=A0A0N1I2W9_LEPSE|nr:hypothetical protein ABL78_5878 [Leptomonas seymouri]|eukprot:KPI85073.1 hypothetical protein ABL78_5878 [Leptomonas seymouri]
MNSSSSTCCSFMATLHWEWWMLVIIGFVSTALVTTLIVAVFCVFRHWFPCRNNDSTDAFTRYPHEEERSEQAVSTEPNTTAPSKSLSSEDESSVVEAPSRISQNADFGLRSCSSSVMRSTTSDFGATIVVSRPPARAPLLSKFHPVSEVVTDPSSVPTMENASLFGLDGKSRSAPPEEILSTVIRSESPKAQIRRQRSIASHMELGLSREESVRLHLMRHRATSDPAFGTFLRSSRSKK